MKGLYALAAVLAVAACAPQPSPPVASAPPPAPPPAAAPPPAPPMMMASFDGNYYGPMILQASGQDMTYLHRSGCTEQRRGRMTVRNGKVFIRYDNWKGHKLHYRGTVDASGAVTAYHLNEDGSHAMLTGQMQNNGFIGNMLRGPCDYMLNLARR
jgi:hypothetical protein